MAELGSLKRFFLSKLLPWGVTMSNLCVHGLIQKLKSSTWVVLIFDDICSQNPQQKYEEIR